MHTKMLRCLSLLLFFVFTSLLVLASGKGCHGYKLYEVTPSTFEQFDILHHLSQNPKFYHFLKIGRSPNLPTCVAVNSTEQLNFQQLLQQSGIKHKVLSENFGETIERDFQHNLRLRQLKSIAGQGRLSTERYYTHDEINTYIEDLAKRYPTRVFLRRVNKSYEGRWLKTLTITNGDGRPNKNVILMDGGFHANEWISPAAVTYVIEQLVVNFHENADILLDYDWVILPVVNLDGYEYTQTLPENRLWRKTRQHLDYMGEIVYGTDPNRNFDFHWNEDGASSDPWDDTFAGPKAFSEPEVVVVRDLINTLKGRGMMYLTIHAYGNLVLYPWGWTSDLPDTWEDLHEVAKSGADAILEATGGIYTVGSSTNIFYVAAGASDDYAFNAGFPISFTMELSSGGANCFDPPPESIDSYVKEAWVGIRAMAVKMVEKYPLKKTD